MSFLIALLWCYGHAYFFADRGMPLTDHITRSLIKGSIISIPTQTNTKTQFQFLATHLDAHTIHTRILLSCYEKCPPLRAGQTWQFQATLRQARNLENPGRFDYVRSLQAKHIHWLGYIQPHSCHLIAEDHPFFLLSMRQYLDDLLTAFISNQQTLGIVEALTLGITTHIEKTQWDLFRRTGTTHLMVISGAHIGLMAGFFYGIVRWAWSHCQRLCLHIPAQKIASIVALIIAFLYALLSGFAVPAQRALLVCFFMMLRFISRQKWRVWPSWRYALLIVLLYEPHAVFLPGFYLSFIAVAILISINQRFKTKKIYKTGIMQCACLCGLMPLTVYFFSYASLNGFFANLIAIPWVSFVLVPCSLVALFVGTWVDIPWFDLILNASTHFLLSYLHWIDSWKAINITYSFFDIFTPIALMMAMILAVFLPTLRLLPVMFILVTASASPRHEHVKQGAARIDVLDVGQGLATVIQTAHHTLLYDTGVKFYRGTDMGVMAIIPFLKTQDIKTIDKIIISHPDLDHRGGLSSIEKIWSPKELIVDHTSSYHRGTSCHQHKDWIWDGVLFHFFAITKEFKSKNNSSCILQISNASSSILLTGDIEAPAEEYLVATYGGKLQSSVMLVPHHGSKTSSTLPFLRKINPKSAIVSYGLANRYHFPHQKAINHYHTLHIPLYNTQDCGMVSVLLSEKKTMSHQLFCYRLRHAWW